MISLILYIILALLVGILAGTITGLIPGVHINLVAALLLSATSLAIFANISPLVLAVFIVAMSITHTFVDFIPSIFLGCPDDDTGLSILPGHQLLMKKQGMRAVILTLIGSCLGVLIILIFTPLFILFLPKIYNYIKTMMPFILILVSFFLIIREKSLQLKFIALIVFLLAGFLGIATLNLPLKEPLLPLLTGLFGGSALITSIMKRTKIPKQKIISIKKIKIKFKEITKPFFAALIASPLCSFLPGLGSAQAAVIGSEITGEISQKSFLILLGAINTIVMGLSFITLYSISRARTGAAVAVGKILENISLSNIITIIIVVIFSAAIAFFITIFIAKIFSQKITKINYTKLSLAMILFLCLIIFIFSGFLGLLVFTIATSTGLVAILFKVRRTHLMGSLLLPTILFYLLV